MPSLVETCWGPTPIGDVPYWLLVAPSSRFYKSVRLGRGGVLTFEAAIAHDSAFELALTPPSMIAAQFPREQIFEEVRQTVNPRLPSRLRSAHIFDDQALVERASKERYPNEQRTAHECRLIVGSLIHRADSTWLDADRSQWKESAEKYWNGLMTQTPFPEVLVQGALYFPHWRGLPAR